MEEHRKKLIQAAAGLYGIVHVRQLCDIVAHYTAEKPTRTQLRALLEQEDWTPFRTEQGFIYRPDVFDSLQGWDTVLRHAKNKPFWLPPLPEFLCYADLDHIPQNEAMQALQQLFSEQIQDAEHLVKALYADVRAGCGMGQAMARMMDAGIRVDEEDMQRFGTLLAQLCNETHMFMNHGFAPEQLMRYPE